MKSCNDCMHYNVCKFKEEELCKGTKVKDLLHDCANFEQKQSGRNKYDHT